MATILVGVPSKKLPSSEEDHRAHEPGTQDPPTPDVMDRRAAVRPLADPLKQTIKPPDAPSESSSASRVPPARAFSAQEHATPMQGLLIALNDQHVCDPRIAVATFMNFYSIEDHASKHSITANLKKLAKDEKDHNVMFKLSNVLMHTLQNPSTENMAELLRLAMIAAAKKPKEGNVERTQHIALGRIVLDQIIPLLEITHHSHDHGGLARALWADVTSNAEVRADSLMRLSCGDLDRSANEFLTRYDAMYQACSNAVKRELRECVIATWMMGSGVLDRLNAHTAVKMGRILDMLSPIYREQVKGAIIRQKGQGAWELVAPSRAQIDAAVDQVLDLFSNAKAVLTSASSVENAGTLRQFFIAAFRADCKAAFAKGVFGTNTASQALVLLQGDVGMAETYQHIMATPPPLSVYEILYQANATGAFDRLANAYVAMDQCLKEFEGVFKNYDVLKDIASISGFNLKPIATLESRLSEHLAAGRMPMDALLFNFKKLKDESDAIDSKTAQEQENKGLLNMQAYRWKLLAMMRSPEGPALVANYIRVKEYDPMVFDGVTKAFQAVQTLPEPAARMDSITHIWNKMLAITGTSESAGEAVIDEGAVNRLWNYIMSRSENFPAALREELLDGFRAVAGFDLLHG